MNFEHLKKTLGYVQEIITARQHGVKNLWNKYNEAKLTEQILIQKTIEQRTHYNFYG